MISLLQSSVCAMATKLRRDGLSSSDEGVLLNGRYRVRLFDTNDVPILCNIRSLVGPEIVVIDLPNAEGLELKHLNVGTRLSGGRRSGGLEDDKENVVPDGCMIGGDPLHISFLTIEKLEKGSKRSNNKYDNVVMSECNPFKTHLLTSTEALEFLNDLETDKIFDESLSNLTCVVLADASNCNNLLFLARQKTNKSLVNSKAMLLGNTKGAINEINAMTAQLQLLHTRRCVCRCRFDVLRNVILFQRPENFIPALFMIEAEWAVALPKTRGQRRVVPFENFLAMPPDNARVIVKFKPGWLDERVVLTTNIYELKHLADLASALKAGKIPWIEKEAIRDEDAESDFMLQRVTELIENARDKPDIEAVYPFDFADRLWDIVRTVKSAETLKRVFEMIYSELRTGEFRVMVEADKVSSLAKMLRVRNLGNMIFPRLEPLTCLQMLVEIGVDRFKGDIQYRFLKGEFISNITDLEPFFLDSCAPVEDRIEQLMPLYLALQSMLMIEKYVRLTPHKKMLMAKRLLAHFTAVKNVDANTKEFSFDISMEDIYRDGLKTSMTEWVMERIYEKQQKSTGDIVIGGGTNTGTFHEIVCLSKYIGFEHVNQVSFEDNTKSSKCDTSKLSIIKEKLNLTTGTGDLSSDNTGTTTDAEPDIEDLFDCIYIVVTSNSMSPFPTTASLA